MKISYFQAKCSQLHDKTLMSASSIVRLIEFHVNSKEKTEMNDSRFDEFTKVLATPSSRRQALKTFAATAVGGILGLSGLRTAFAKCKPNGHHCGNTSQCCGGGCCGGTCTDLSSNLNNCGACGNVCPSGTICNNGMCVSTCAPDGAPCITNSDCCCDYCYDPGIFPPYCSCS